MAHRDWKIIFADMTRSVIKKLTVATALLSVGLLFTRFVWLTPTTIDTPHFDEKVNLALRRTAHHLLAESGDSTSNIPPVERPDANTFLLRLQHSFNYDRLPALLQESFQVHDIQKDYDVAVLSCISDDLLLGYNVKDVEVGVACGGRAQNSDCYNLKVTFASPQSSPLASAGWWILVGGFLLGGISYAAWQWATRRNNLPTLPPIEAETAESVRLHFGASSLDVANQTLLVGTVRYELTYRETKLLHLFVNHLGQLLERDFILQSVWNDEGIIVGRSVDVFVSRLRKMLRDDATIRIATVHGVGYRLEMQGE